MSRRKFKPTKKIRGMVESMAGYGVPHEDIALVIKNPETDRPITAKTLRLHFRDQLDTGHIKANTTVVSSLYTLAKNGNVGACIWWTKARMGWSEKSIHELGGHGGGPIKVTFSIAGDAD